MFDIALQFVLAQEGGIADDAHDPGGATAFGITHITYDRWRTAHNLPTQFVTKITTDEVRAIYKEYYWDAFHLEPMPAVWQLFLFDSYVQHRPEAVQTFIAGNASVSDALWARMTYYIGLSNFQYFGKGWMKRMLHLRIALRAINGQV